MNRFLNSITSTILNPPFGIYLFLNELQLQHTQLTKINLYDSEIAVEFRTMDPTIKNFLILKCKRQMFLDHCILTQYVIKRLTGTSSKLALKMLRTNTQSKVSSIILALWRKSEHEFVPSAFYISRFAISFAYLNSILLLYITDTLYV